MQFDNTQISLKEEPKSTLPIMKNEKTLIIISGQSTDRAIGRSAAKSQLPSMFTSGFGWEGRRLFLGLLKNKKFFKGKIKKKKGKGKKKKYPKLTGALLATVKARCIKKLTLVENSQSARERHEQSKFLRSVIKYCIKLLKIKKTIKLKKGEKKIKSFFKNGSPLQLKIYDQHVSPTNFVKVKQQLNGL